MAAPAVLASRMSERAALAAAALMIAGASIGHTSPLFRAPALSYETGGAPSSLAIADVDEDGRPDVVVTNSGSGTISLLIGRGDGTFFKRDMTLDHSPTSVVDGDLDGDGHVDLVVSNYPLVSVMLGNGDGTFRAGVNIEDFAGALAIGDVNEDGRLDLAVANNMVSVLLGNGDGTFGSRANIPAPGAGSVAIADFNSDGRPDLVASNSGAYPTDEPPWCNAVFVSMGNGDGTFGPASGFGIGEQCGSVAVGDLSGDGRPDLVVTNSNDRNETGSILLGNGNGTFESQSGFHCGVGPFGVAFADLDGDGNQDFVVTNRGGDPDAISNSVSVFLGDGRGNIRAAGEFGVRNNPMAVGVADFDADGHPDLVVTNLGSQSVSVLIGNGDGTFGTPAVHTPGYPRSVAIADFDGDGKPDLAVPVVGDYPSYTGLLSVLLGNGNGTFRAMGSFALGAGSGSVTGATAAADLDGDGKQDLAVTNAGAAPDWAGFASVLLGNGDGTFRARTDYATGMISSSVAIADIDGDGNRDLVVGNSGSWPTHPSTVSILLGNGNGTFRPATNVVVGTQASSVAIADLDADGRPDLAVANDGGGRIVSVLLGNGDGTFRTAPDVQCAPWSRSVAIGDLDGDGRPDLGLATGAAAAVLIGNGDGTFETCSSWEIGTDRDASAIAIGDFDLDGRLDLAVSTDDVDGVVSVLIGNGDGTFRPRVIFGAGWYPQSMATGDLDGDGRPDLVVANEWSKSVSILLNAGLGPPPTAAIKRRALGRAPAAPCLSLEGFHPNPAFGAPAVAFTLSDDSPAVLEVLDLAGRRVLRRDVGALGSGRHVLTLRASTSFTPGVYVVRLRQAGTWRSSLGTVVR